MQNKNRKSIRLKKYNYSEPGDYFVTICTKDRSCILGDVRDEKMILNEIGNIVDRCLLKITEHFSNTELDIFQIMPNHIHFILRILEEDFIVGNRHACSSSKSDTNIRNSHGCSLQEEKRQYQKLPVIVGSFKSSVTRICKQNNLSIQWQKSYYDEIIINEKHYSEVYDYILSNPQTWDRDRNNPKNSDK
ncbi:MAG: transposase [Patescibacteria group bacterium]|nr:transposase [Patescibacteria group bacterium]